jgi:hypothetical protein
MDLTVLFGLAALYLAYRVGRWAERGDAASQLAGERAAELADMCDEAVARASGIKQVLPNPHLDDDEL